MDGILGQSLYVLCRCGFIWFWRDSIMDNIFSRAGDTMKNYKGIAETVLLLWIIVGLTLFFVPNPVSKVVGVGIQPNKTIERVELIKDKEGVPIAYRTTITEQQQKPTFMQGLLNLSPQPQSSFIPVLIPCFPLPSHPPMGERKYPRT